MIDVYRLLRKHMDNAFKNTSIINNLEFKKKGKAFEATKCYKINNILTYEFYSIF